MQFIYILLSTIAALVTILVGIPIIMDAPSVSDPITVESERPKIVIPQSPIESFPDPKIIPPTQSTVPVVSTENPQLSGRDYDAALEAIDSIESGELSAKDFDIEALLDSQK